ncbi:chitinase C-terminal domain-containing protein [Undibacterium rugosum]|nr:glycosyl hydrolase family 18 protein [Undibacterium rugosum]
MKQQLTMRFAQLLGMSLCAVVTIEAQAACSSPAWDAAKAYNGGAKVSYQDQEWSAKWWTQANPPKNDADGPWKFVANCSGGGGGGGGGGGSADPVLVTPPLPPGSALCRPDGMAVTAGVNAPYCQAYDSNGREKLGKLQRRVIGYFTSWRTGKDGSPAYLAHQIPWDKLSHINYAFAHVDSQNRISVGEVSDPNNAATSLQWPGVAGAEMDPGYAYKGHFNLLNKFKKQYPQVKTLISVGGWAETGGYFDSTGKRVNSGGFYAMTTNADNSVNQAGINTFADSVVAFLRQYNFDGVDIDYEYPTSMKDAGNPLDFSVANARRPGLMKSYSALMKTLREKLDAAAAQDNRYYLLTIAAPASAYLLRGMENSPALAYLDFANLMSYDLHGAWNEFVGPNAALFDDGKDAELARWSVYSSAQYGGIGYLNSDWAYHYLRGAMQSGRINVGVPYYTRGWRNVTGGSNGLWGKSLGSNCPPGTTVCGAGAIGIDNLWRDLDAQGKEVPAGGNPMWHAKNLERGVAGSYLTSYGLNPASNPDDRLVGSYVRNYDATLVAPWLWNAQKNVFISTEDEASVQRKAQWIIAQGIGGVMFWELAGDYDWNAARGEYFMGSSLTRSFYQAFSTATPYGNLRSKQAVPTAAIDLLVEVTGYKLGDANYPINPTLKITNRSGFTLAGGTEIQFDLPTSTPDNTSDQSGMGLRVLSSGHSGNNIGGLKGDLHRMSFKLPAWSGLAPNASTSMTLNYYLPVSGPANFSVIINGKAYALRSEQPYLPYIK